MKWRVNSRLIQTKFAAYYYPLGQMSNGLPIENSQWEFSCGESQESEKKKSSRDPLR